jgi:hypothetical protein
LVIAGRYAEDDYVKSLRQLVDSEGCSGEVIWIAQSTFEDRSDILNSIDILVFLADSLHDSFPVVTLEAMSSGCVLVVSDWDGLKDLPNDCVRKVRTYLSPFIRDDPNQYANEAAFSFNSTQACVPDETQLRRILSDLIASEDERRKISRRARETVVSRFSWAALIPRYEAVFCRLLARADRLGPAAYRARPRARAFMHYPSAWLSDSVLVRANPETTPRPMPQVGFIEDLGVPDAVLREARDWIPIKRLLRTLGEKKLPGWRANLAVSYLIKQGFLRIRSR